MNTLPCYNFNDVRDVTSSFYASDTLSVSCITRQKLLVAGRPADSLYGENMQISKPGRPAQQHGLTWRPVNEVGMAKESNFSKLLYCVTVTKALFLPATQTLEWPNCCGWKWSSGVRQNKTTAAKWTFWGNRCTLSGQYNFCIFSKSWKTSALRLPVNSLRKM